MQKHILRTYLARVRPGDGPAPVDGVQVCMEKNGVNPSPVPQHAVCWSLLLVTRYRDVRRQFVMMSRVRAPFNIALSHEIICGPAVHTPVCCPVVMLSPHGRTWAAEPTSSNRSWLIADLVVGLQLGLCRSQH